MFFRCSEKQEYINIFCSQQFGKVIVQTLKKNYEILKLSIFPSQPDMWFVVEFDVVYFPWKT